MLRSRYMFMYAVHFMVALSALLCICVCDSMYVLMRLVLLSCVYVCALRARSAVKYFYVSTRSCFLVLLLLSFVRRFVCLGFVALLFVMFIVVVFSLCCYVRLCVYLLVV